MKIKNIKKAFTLTEVLVTLIILGIVAIIIIPAALNFYKKVELETRFKKTYLSLVEIHQKICEDNNWNIDDMNEMFETQEGGDKYRKKVYESIKNLDPTCFDRTKQKCRIWSSVTYEDYKGGGRISVAPTYFERLPGGAALFFNYPKYWNSPYFFLVDTNGPNKGPNRAGFDVFVFDLESKNKIIPANYYDCNKMRAGSGGNCAVYALQNICPEDRSKTYWDCLPR